MMIACPRVKGAPRLPKIGGGDGQERDRRCMPHSQDPEAWTIPSMNEVPTWPAALLIRGCGTDARTGINSRVDVLGNRPRNYCVCVV